MSKPSPKFLQGLKQAIDDENEEKLIEAIDVVETQRLQKAVPTLLKILISDKRIGVKNAAAIALGELKANTAIPILMKFIRSPEFQSENGTFVYALQSLDWFKKSQFRIEFAILLASNSFEVRSLALESIRDASKNLNTDQRADLLVGLSFASLKAIPIDAAVRETLTLAWKLMAGHKADATAEYELAV